MRPHELAYTHEATFAYNATTGPRERALSGGVGALPDPDLMSIVLGTGFSGVHVSSLARTLLDRFGGLEGLSRLGPGALAAAPGLGPAKALRLTASFELGRRTTIVTTTPREALDSSAAVARWCEPRITGLLHEEIWALSVDGRNGLRGARKVSQGGAHGCAVAAREVLRSGVCDAAHGVILVHNHPSGDPSPSPEDLALTRSVSEGGDVVGVPLLDHVIVSPGRYASLLDLGMLRRR